MPEDVNHLPRWTRFCVSDSLKHVVTNLSNVFIISGVSATGWWSLPSQQLTLTRMPTGGTTPQPIPAVMHHTLTHLETSGSCIRLLFLDYCSAFNTIILQTLVNKLAALGLVPSLCNWILDLTNRPQSVRINNITSAPIILNTDCPKAVFSAHFSIHCLLMTTEITITATLWWRSWMKAVGRRWADCDCGIKRTI